MFAFDPSRQDSPNVQGMRTLGTGELEVSRLQDLIKVSHSVLAFFAMSAVFDHCHNLQQGEKYARNIWSALNAKLKEENVARLKDRTKF